MDILRPTEKSEVFDDSKRFDQIKRLRQSLQLEPDNLLTYGLEVPKSSTTTIGIEIEMSWMQTFPELAEDWQDPNIRPRDANPRSPERKKFDKSYDKLDRQLKPILREIERVIPRVGADAYWEFSFLPVKQIGITLAELAILYDAHILREGVPYATHMTVAGIDNDRDAFAFLCGLELSGGTSADRIASARSSTKGAWSRKGKGGLMRRDPDELMGDDEVGYEFRTLIARSPQQMSSLLHTAAHLAEMYHSDPDAWKDYRRHIERFLKQKDLPLEVWSKPMVAASIWTKYEALLK